MIKTKIEKAPETMTARERVLNTFAFQKTDRVPINYSSNPLIHAKTMAALGCAPDDDETFMQLLGVDYRCAYVTYTGPLLYKEVPGLIVNPEYGFYTRWVKNAYGGYHDFCNFPLKGASDEAIMSYPFPSPDDFDYDGAVERLKSYGDHAIHSGGAGLVDIINSIGRIVSMEDILVGLQTEDETILGLIDRKLDMELCVQERLLDKAKGRIDFLWMGEDLGTQCAPMISLELYRKVFRPRHQRFIDLAKSYNIPVMVHTCGASCWVYEDFIEMGVTAVDALQPEVPGMSPECLIKHFGGRLSLHSCISTAGVLAFGTTDEVTQYCKNLLEIVMGYGYHFAPAHMIQDNTPVENIIALYQAAHNYGRF